MTAATQERDRAPDPKPPSLAAYIACALELSMLVIFLLHGSATGTLVWIGYFYFSATRSLVMGQLENDND